MTYSLPFSKKEFFRYTLSPEFGRHIRDLIGSGFSNLAYFIALVYNAVGILPNGHNYVNSSYVGKYGIRHVVAAAANHVKFDLKHLDQVFIFFAVISGLFLLALQFVVLAASFITNPAIAAGIPTTYTEFFVTPNPATDLAYKMMFLVFGVDMFGNTGAAPYPIHLALHRLFEFYSYGMLIVGTFIILYFVVTIVAETANTGVPFGKRFSHAWVPVRLIFFFALLMPLEGGLNSAQWITLSAAKYGSSLATNSWIRFNTVLSSSYLGDTDTLIATPNAPEMMHIPVAMLTNKTCQWAVGRSKGIEVEAWLIHGPGAAGSTPLLGLGYQQALNLSAPANGPAGDLVMRFGEKDPVKYEDLAGAVFPDCGEIVLKTLDVSEEGSAVIQEGYFEMIQEMWAPGSQMDLYGQNFSYRFSSIQPRDPFAVMPPDDFKATLAQTMNQTARQLIQDGVIAQLAANNFGVEPEILELGWAGAGIWYNKIAEQNGAITAAAANTPSPKLQPAIMESVRSEKMKNDQNVQPTERYRPMLSDGDRVEFSLPEDEDIARVLNQAYELMEENGLRADDLATHAESTGNAFIDTINSMLGTHGLFDMCRNTDIHPLAQLSAVGKGMIDSAISNLLKGGIFGIAGGTGIIQGQFAGAAQAVAGFFGSLASIGMMIGFLLYYVLPFLPFIYFFFAVGGWIKEVFEAMVGMPLWALAHLRIDGNGIPAKAANNGYLLIFEVFLRPVLIIFGLLASIVIFSAQVKALNEIFHLVISNVAGSNPVDADSACATGSLSSLTQAELGQMTGEEMLRRGPVDEIFFTVIYAVIVYMMGLASFKLIDLIPNMLMRWFGSGVSSFNDDNAAAKGAQDLMKYSTIGGASIGSQLQEAVNEFPEELGKASAEVRRRAGVASDTLLDIYETSNRGIINGRLETFRNTLARDPVAAQESYRTLRGMVDSQQEMLELLAQHKARGGMNAELTTRYNRMKQEIQQIDEFLDNQQQQHGYR